LFEFCEHLKGCNEKQRTGAQTNLNASVFTSHGHACSTRGVAGGMLGPRMARHLSSAKEAELLKGKGHVDENALLLFT
jgi:hypothetical protein